jgi:hypothetical protein
VENASLGSAWQSFLVLANPSTTTAQVQVRWMTSTGGTVEQRAEVPPQGRAVVEPTGVAAQQTARADLTSSVSIVVERSAYEREGIGVASGTGTPQ